MENSLNLAMYGFKTEGQSSHNARTMMLKEMVLLLQAVNNSNATKDEYIRAIIENNCLGKNSGITRKKSVSHLMNMYALDPGLLVFSALRYFWQRDQGGHPLLALTCVFSRDYLIKKIAPFILEKNDGEKISKEPIKEILSDLRPGVFSNATLESTAQNILSTFTQSGHLKGKINKIRTRAIPTAGNVAYSLLLGYFCEYRGELLLSCEYVNLLDCSLGKIVELAEAASRSGWISFKHIDNVYDVSFPNKDLGVTI